MKISLKALRVNAELTQAEAAKKMNVRRETIQNWESHKTFPSIGTLCKLCELYGCTMDDIFIPSTLTESKRNKID